LVRHTPSAFTDIHNRIWLFAACSEDAAWPVKLEASTDNTDAVCEERRCKSIAGKALVLAPVEAKAHRARAVDEAAAWKPSALR
jgi:hypothetical protein